MKINSDFSFSKVKFDEGKEVHLVVSLTAPKMDWQKKRASVCVIPVIDISGSMQGEKLDYAKKSVMKLIDHLMPGDYCGMVAFESNVHPIAAPMEMTQSKKEELKTKVGNLATMGCTNIAGGMVQALEWINKTDLKEGTLLRVIIFTDGQPNVGVSDPAGLVKLLKTAKGRASLSAFGYGQDCNQELLASMAKEGEGNYAFIKDPDKALTAFAKELGGLLGTYAQNIVVDIAPFNGHELTDVISDVDSEEDDKKVKIKLRDILSEETRHLVVAVKLSPQTKALPRPMNVADIIVDYDIINEKGEKEHKKEEIKAKIEFVKDGEQQDKPTPEVDKIVGQAQFVRKQIEAEEQAAKGNYQAAQVLLCNMAGEYKTRGLVDLEAISNKASVLYSSNASYTSSSGYRNAVSRGMSRGMSVACCDADAAGDLKAFNGLDNEMQRAMVDSFTDDSTSAPQPSVAGSFIIPGVPSAVQASSSISISIPPVDDKPSKGKLSKSRSKRW